MALVPAKAKSAATMICLGASKIVMGGTSELGTVDPQIVVEESGKVKWFSLYTLVKSYEALFAEAVREKGNLQPYIQQLANYDAREIAEFRTALSLSEDIAIKSLQSGMFRGLHEKQIKSKIRIFVIPEKAKVHGRAIYADEARDCGLNVDIKDVRDEMWSFVYELYVRLNNYVSTNNMAKCIESSELLFGARAPKPEREQ